MQTDTVVVVKKMLDYLNFDYDTEELEKRLNSDYGRFHRYAELILGKLNVTMIIWTVWCHPELMIITLVIAGSYAPLWSNALSLYGVIHT